MLRAGIMLLTLLSLAAPLQAEEVKVYDKYWRLKYRVKDAGPEGMKVYDKYYRLKYRVRGRRWLINTIARKAGSLFRCKGGDDKEKGREGLKQYHQGGDDGHGRGHHAAKAYS